MLTWLLGFVALGAAGTLLARRYALARALIDQPGERRSHTAATPRGGGIAIVVSMLVAVGLVAWRVPGEARWLLGFGFGVLAVGLIGLIDDHRPLSATARLCVHVLASAVLASAIATETSFMFGLFAFFACVVFINVWNFMDGINGIAATQAALVSAAIATHGRDPVVPVALALAGACIGFLPFNLPRARIFLGDVGSGAIGFAVAALSTRLLHDAPSSWIVVALAPSAFLVDSGLTLFRRFLRGEQWWTPHTQHAYQVAARRWGHPRVTSAYGIWTVASVVLAETLGDLEVRFMVASAAAWYTSAALLWLWLQRFEPRTPLLR